MALEKEGKAWRHAKTGRGNTTFCKGDFLKKYGILTKKMLVLISGTNV